MTKETLIELCYILTYELGVKVSYKIDNNDIAHLIINGNTTNLCVEISEHLVTDWGEVL